MRDELRKPTIQAPNLCSTVDTESKYSGYSHSTILTEPVMVPAAMSIVNSSTDKDSKFPENHHMPELPTQATQEPELADLCLETIWAWCLTDEFSARG